MSYLYLDTSTLISLALGDQKRSAVVIPLLKKFKNLICSEVSVVEGQSGISFQYSNDGRKRVTAEQNFNRVLTRLNLFCVSSLVLGHARVLVKSYRRSFGLRSLDAIHIATANLVRQQVAKGSNISFEYVTSDERQHEVFTAEGYIGTFIP